MFWLSDRVPLHPVSHITNRQYANHQLQICQHILIMFFFHLALETSQIYCTGRALLLSNILITHLTIETFQDN